MMASRYVRRTREYRGIQPNSVAIGARSISKQPTDWLTQKNRIIEDRLRDIEDQVQEQKRIDFRTDFETTGARRKLAKTVYSQVKTLTAANESNLECRREKLQNLLASEEDCYFKEMEMQGETMLERQAKMRERAKFLKDKREAERLVFVQEKYDQQFRRQCEEVRSALSRKHLDQVCLDRIEQVHEKEEIKTEKKAYDEMYARLWEQDMLEKAAREEREVKDLQDRNRGVLDVLRKQMAALEAQKEESKRLKQEEAQLMNEQKALWDMEKEFQQKEKIDHQNETRRMLDSTMASKARKKAKEEHEQLAFDLKMLQQLLQESHEEASGAIQRKRELREEDRQYREYLKQLIEEEKCREKELESIIQQQMEAAWEKRIEQWRKDRLARQLLMNEVMEGRARQISERLQENERHQMEAIHEREHLLCKIRENQRLEAEGAANRLAENVKYQQDLAHQMAYNTAMREVEQQLDKEEHRKAQQTEEEYQTRKKLILDNPIEEKVHPLRRAVLAQSADQGRPPINTKDIDSQGQRPYLFRSH